jgi:RNA polymerase sigma-70 factor, ECF subfamily
MLLCQAMSASDLTLLLQRAARGDSTAQDRVLDLLYGELHKMAEIALRTERAEHTLQATALVHEAYMRLFGAHQVEWQSRQHFFVTASRTIRRILVDYARKHNSQKRGGEASRVDFENALVIAKSYSREFVELDQALEELANADPRKSQVVELRFFGGMTMDEIASLLKVSENTVKRDWNIARAWLQSRIEQPAG